MEQIRVCRSARVSHFRQDVLVYGEWDEATEATMRDCHFIVQVANELFGPNSHWIEHRRIEPDRVRPELAVKRLVDESMQAWIAGDLTRHLLYFTAGATLITPTGSCHHGREGLRIAFARERATLPGLSMKVEERQITHPSSDTAVVMMEGSITHAAAPQPERWASTQTMVFSPETQWLIASHQVFHARRTLPMAA